MLKCEPEQSILSTKVLQKKVITYSGKRFSKRFFLMLFKSAYLTVFVLSKSFLKSLK